MGFWLRVSRKVNQEQKKERTNYQYLKPKIGFGTQSTRAWVINMEEPKKGHYKRG